MDRRCNVRGQTLNLHVRPSEATLLLRTPPSEKLKAILDTDRDVQVLVMLLRSSVSNNMARQFRMAGGDMDSMRTAIVLRSLYRLAVAHHTTLSHRVKTRLLAQLARLDGYLDTPIVDRVAGLERLAD